MKKFFTGVSLFTCAALSAHALPQLKIGEGAELFVTAGLGIQADDNVLLSDLDEVSDTVIDFVPGLDLVFGGTSQVSGSLSFAESISRYLDNDYLNRELGSTAFRLTYDDGKVKTGVAASFQQLNQNTRNVRGPLPVRRDELSAAVNTEVHATEKTSISAGINYGDTNYNTAGYVDVQEYSVPVNYYYTVTEKVDLSGGLRYRKTSVDKNLRDSTDLYYNIGARGKFTPKLTGFFTVGYVTRNVDRGSDQSSLGAESDLTYLVTEKTSVQLSASNDFGTSAEGASQETFSTGVTVISDLSSQWQASIGTHFQKDRYFGSRTDDYMDVRFAAVYRLSAAVKLSAGYTYRKNDSDVSYLDSRGRSRSDGFTNSIFNFSVEVRY